MRGRPFGNRRSGRNAAERGIATVFKEKRMPRRHPFVLAGSVSRVLYSAARFRCGAPVIYLRRRSPAASSNLPPDIGRATLNCRYTRSCNPRDVLPGDIAAPAVGSYPAFSPLPAGKSLVGGSFLLRSYTLTDIKSLACAALCVARTFLSRPRPAATERTCTAKVIKFGGIPASGGARYSENAFPSSVRAVTMRCMRSFLEISD